MQEFKQRYQALNASQKKAVDSIDGPVMVVAGPGTGKTELLSVRVANILQKNRYASGKYFVFDVYRKRGDGHAPTTDQSDGPRRLQSRHTHVS